MKFLVIQVFQMYHPEVCKNGYIYIPVNAFKFFEEGAKPPFPDLTEDSNPVIVKLKLKK